MSTALAEQTDASQPLENWKWEAVVKEVALNGKSGGQAWQSVYPNTTPGSAQVSACRLLSAPKVMQRIAWLREQKQAKSAMNRSEKLELCAQFARLDLSRPQSELLKLAQGAKYDRETGHLVEIKVPDKLRAIELASKLDGDLVEPGGGVTIVNLDLLRVAVQSETMAGNGQIEAGMCPKLAGSESVASGEAPTE